MSKPLYGCLFIFLATIVFSNAQAQQVFKTTKNSVIGYLEYLPSDYHKNSNDYPIVIFLHGKGEKGPKGNNPKELEKGVGALTRIGPPRHAKNGTDFPFILISPQLKGNYGDWPSSYVMEVIEHVKTYLRIDEKRIYLTGLSLGGGGTWSTAQDYPNLFAAIAPVCGSRNSTGKACKLSDAKLPVWAFHGNKDNIVPYSRSVNMVNAINGCSPKIRAKLTTYPGVAHNSWDKAYDPSHNVHSPNVYDWMLSFVNNNTDDNNDGKNKNPDVNAGSDKTISLPVKSLDLTGSATDKDGSISSYSWTKTSGGTATLSGATSNKLKVSDLAEGSYVFKLTVKDNKGASASDEVKVTVKASSTGKNASPVANAGSDKVISLPKNAVELVGKATDSDGKIKSCKWEKVSGGNASLSGASYIKVMISSLAEGTYTFRLTVKDDKGASHADEVTVTVKGTGKTNVSPKANAGSDQTITLPTNAVTLNGNATDADGKVTAYTWTKISGSSASLNNATTPTLTVSNLAKGNYVFRLTVKDDKGASQSDDVTVVVNATSASNKAPVANAGSDRIITLPTNSVVLYSSATDDGKIVSYNWGKARGGRASLQGTNSSTLTASNLEEGIYYFTLLVKDDKGLVDEDKVMVIVNKAKSKTASRSAAPAAFTLASTTAEPLNENLSEEAAAAELPTTEKFELAGNDLTRFKDCEVVIFNQSLQRIYSGVWESDSYTKILNANGMYYYNVMRQGKRVDAGKIYIR